MIPLMSDTLRWVVFAVLGAFFAAVVQLTTKPALEKLEVASANLIRAAVMILVFIAAVVWGREWTTLREAGPRPLLLVAASGVAAGLSGLCGYRALKLASISQSYPLDKTSVVFAVILAYLLLGDRPSGWNWLGITLILGGAFLVALPRN